MKKLSKILLGASLSALLFAGCSNSLIANDTLDTPDITAKVTENGVIVLKWDAVKDAEGYRVYSKAPGTEEWNYTWNNSDNLYYVASVSKLDSEYKYKVVAIPNNAKTNLLASEAEISVDTPEAWVDTAAFAASDIKLSLVPNTANQYELNFPVDAGFKYEAKLVEVTAADSTSPADLFTQTGYELEPVYIYDGSEINYYTWITEQQNYESSVQSAATVLYGKLVAASVDTSDIASALSSAESGDFDALEDLVNNNLSGDSEATEALTDFESAYAELQKYSSGYTRTSSSVVSAIRTAFGYSFITELDEDDNVVSPVFDYSVVVSNPGVEYRVVVKMSPVNSQVATTKYVLSSQTVKYDATGAEVTGPTGIIVTPTSSTKGTFTFYVNKFNGKEADASNYRIYQKLTIATKDSNGISTGSTTELTYLGTATKDSTYTTTSTDDVRYKYDYTKQENTSTASYSYTYYLVYTNANDDAVWTQLNY